MSGEAKPPHETLLSYLTTRAHRIIVETSRELHAHARATKVIEHRRIRCCLAELVCLLRVRYRLEQDTREVAFSQPARHHVVIGSSSGSMSGVRKHHRGGGIEHSGRRHVECQGRTAQELSVEGVERCVDAPMQAIQPTQGQGPEGGYTVSQAAGSASGLKSIEQIARERLGRRSRGDRSAPRSGARIRADRDSR